jgi:hypothetical protein
MANGTIAVSQLEILTQSGTGIITVVPPATNTNRTLTLPDVTGTVAVQGGTGVGKVLQVVQGTTQTSVSTTSTSYVTTNLTASITPTLATSKVLVLFSISGYNDTGGGQCIATVFRGTVAGTNLGATNSSGFGAAFSGAGETMSNISGIILDAPSTTSATTYTVGFKRKTSGTAYVLVDGQLATLTLMEIAA